MIAENSPQYYIRIFPSLLGRQDGNLETEINSDSISAEGFPLRVLSVSTDKDITNPAGSWSIELAYENADFSDDSWFMKIQPMDYVEIYMRREKIEAEVYHPEFGYSIVEEVPFFGRFSTTDWDKPNFLVYYNYKDNLFWKGFDKGVPLTIAEKVISPDLILCGFVDEVQNKFSISGGTPQNKLILAGRDVAKFLQEHEVFFNYLDPTFWSKQQLSQMTVPTLKAADVLNFILTLYLELWLEGNSEPTKPKDKESKDYIAWKSDTTTIRADYTKSLQEGEITYITRVASKPNSRFIYWDIAERVLGEADATQTSTWWARIEDSSPRVLRAGSPFVTGKLWTILHNQIASEQNELWMDETGNLVLRKFIDAWTQPDTTAFNINSKTQQDFIKNVADGFFKGVTNTKELDLRDIVKPNDRPWMKITSADIISWDLKKSDKNLKTLVTVESTTNLRFGKGNLETNLGQAPLTQEVLDRAVNLLRLNDANAEDIKQLQYAHLKNISTFYLGSTTGIQKFWYNFGVRPASFGDQYSATMNEFFESALTLLEKFANLWWTGSVTVKGDSKYRVGRILEISDLDLVFYVVGVSHKFIWGQSWTTTLKVIRGSKKYALSDYRIKLTPTSKSALQPSPLIDKTSLGIGNWTLAEKNLPRL